MRFVFAGMALAAAAVTVAVALGGFVWRWYEVIWAWAAVAWCGVAALEEKP